MKDGKSWKVGCNLHCYRCDNQMNSLHRHPRESGDPSDSKHRMDPRFREDDGVESSCGLSRGH